ncbi:hypothetical protein QWJ34_20720 [Saccharibacillus sp. CPCC 101409]|uniref:hypothetical protein n=1 Tax=Saccharibacillus sp. CPCC 101409 TaxID=3058041 RepID=UPI0026715AA5|nr:hypothetical protein [Saccharibacillus sp. CPCC 101409]MDO3412199.1 hypothetical protein [Saccharibacillus sp. CPCC 101409]
MSDAARYEREDQKGWADRTEDAERVLRECYAPYLMFDLREPFLPDLVGFTRLERGEESPSFPRSFEDADPRTDCILEYAVWWDYEIGHLHQLEQIWIYVGPNGEVLDCEATFHGRVLKGLLKNRSNLTDATHVRLFSQPGKHALSPLPDLFELLPDLHLASGPRAGEDGLYAGTAIGGLLPYGDNSGEVSDRVKRYLRSFAFKPTLEYTEYRLRPEQFLPWPALKEAIPLRMADRLLELELIFGRSGAQHAVQDAAAERRTRRCREAGEGAEQEEAR